MKTIVTHVSPDLDAIASAWLLLRYAPKFENAQVVFVNTGNPDRAVLAQADAVVDTGGTYNPYLHCYDHHQMKNPNEACAAMLVWRDLMYLHGINPYTPDVAHLEPLVQLIHAGDCGLPEADESRKNGIHAMVSEMKYQQFEDAVIFRLGCVLLDFIAGHLSSGIPFDAILRDVNAGWGDLFLKPAQLRAEELKRTGIAPYVAYMSFDGAFVALRDAPQGATQLAFEQGAQLVLWSNYTENAIGINRARGIEVHVGELVDSIQVYAVQHNSTILATELASWYRHNSGFFSGRGTAKAPREDTIPVDFTTLAAIVDASWER